MKIALDIVLIAFAVLYCGGGIGAKRDNERWFCLAAAMCMIAALIVSIAVL